MPQFLKAFGSHYEVSRADDATLVVDVIHRNSSELNWQLRSTSQEWWRRYSHRGVDHEITAVRHAGNLVRTYSAESEW